MLKEFVECADDKLLRDKAFNIAKNPKYDGYQHGLASMVYKFFNKKSSGGAIKKEIIQNEELVKELHKPIIRKCKKREVYSSFIDNVCGADVVYIQLISKLNKRFRFLLMFIANVHGLFL